MTPADHANTVPDEDLREALRFVLESSLDDHGERHATQFQWWQHAIRLGRALHALQAQAETADGFKDQYFAVCQRAEAAEAERDRLRAESELMKKQRDGYILLSDELGELISAAGETARLYPHEGRFVRTALAALDRETIDMIARAALAGEDTP